MDSWKLWWVYDGYIMGIWCLYHGYTWKFPCGGWWLQTASPEMRGTASRWPIPHPLTCNKASMVCSSGLGAWPAGIHITSHQLLEPAGPGKDKPKSPKKRKAALSVSMPTRACLHIDKSLCIYNTIKYHIYIYVHYTHYTLYAYIFVCICIWYVYIYIATFAMYTCTRSPCSTNRMAKTTSEPTTRSTGPATGGKVKPQRKRETYPGKEVVFTNQTWDVWLIYKLLTLSWFVHKSSQI